MTAGGYSPTELMTVAASRLLRDTDVCFVGIGVPSTASNLARLTHAPNITLIYESGTIAARPEVLPLSIGDGQLCETALTTVSVPEVFKYWLQGSRVSVGFLGGAQIDRFANLNTTVIGRYDAPTVRLPGGGGAPEIAAQCHGVYVVMPQTRRSFVKTVDFITTFGFGTGGRHRAQLGLTTDGPLAVITDLCLMRPDGETKELVVSSLHPGVTPDHVRDHTGWPVRFADDVLETPEPTAWELHVLRDLQHRSSEAHAS
jgi:glutaconate CoA-transferase, subunit B